MDTIALSGAMKQHAFRPEESSTVNLLFWLQRCYPFFLLNNDGNQKKPVQPQRSNRLKKERRDEELL